MNSSHARILVFVSVVFMVTIAIGFQLYSAPEEELVQDSATKDAQLEEPNDASNTGIAEVSKQLPYESKRGNLVKSLKGIYFDRDLAVDEQGNLRLSSDLKDIFDFFFSAIEEESLETVLARIDEYLEYKLEEPALSQAKQNLADYVKYKTALYDFEVDQSDSILSFMNTDNPQATPISGNYLSFVAQRQDQVKALRAEYLGEALHDAFYASREQYDDFMIRSLSINADNSLTQEQKDAQLALLESEMPEDFIAKRNAANPVDALRDSVAAASDQSPAEIYQARAALVGAEAADRLSTLDADRAAWDNRYNAYVQQRDAIASNPGLSDDDKSIALSELRSREFSEQERLRVIALDQINN